VKGNKLSLKSIPDSKLEQFRLARNWNVWKISIESSVAVFFIAIRGRGFGKFSYYRNDFRSKTQET